LTPAHHWRLTRDCKLYDPARDCWCGFDFQPTDSASAPRFLHGSLTVKTDGTRRIRFSSRPGGLRLAATLRIKFPQVHRLHETVRY
jgi:hypothetical protein